MSTQDFLQLLADNAEKELVFEYAANKYVSKAYHITEVKNLSFDSVDCGGNTHSEKQTVVQLYVNPLEIKSRHMAAGKALSILQKVDQVKPLHRPAELFFEYGNAKLPTSNYSIKSVETDTKRLLLKLYVEPTVCRPMEDLKTSVKECCSKLSKCC